MLEYIGFFLTGLPVLSLSSVALTIYKLSINVTTFEKHIDL